MHLRIALLAAALLPVAGNAWAEFPFCRFLHQRHGHPCCDQCQVHVHICKPAETGHSQPVADLPQFAPPTVSPQLMYSQLLPSTIGYTMPMMPMMMPYPVQQASIGTPMQQQPMQSPMQPSHAARDAGCGGCEDRITRLETGVKQLGERMDKIELILENQIIAMGGIRDALKDSDLLKTSPQSRQ